MIPVKIECGCGQNYAFDVEPVNGRMPDAVACPSCGVDGTAAANDIIARSLPATSPVAGPAGVRIAAPSVPTYSPQPAPPPLPAASRPSPRYIPPAESSSGEFNMGMGILGAFLGALVGMGAMFGFYELVGFRFPLLGVGIGLLTGFGAKLLYKGTCNTLGVISGGIALVSVVGTLFLMYGEFPIISIISVVVSVSMAYRIAAD